VFVDTFFQGRVGEKGDPFFSTPSSPEPETPTLFFPLIFSPPVGLFFFFGPGLVFSFGALFFFPPGTQPPHQKNTPPGYNTNPTQTPHTPKKKQNPTVPRIPTPFSPLYLFSWCFFVCVVVFIPKTPHPPNTLFGQRGTKKKGSPFFRSMFLFSGGVVF